MEPGRTMAELDDGPASRGHSLDSIHSGDTAPENGPYQFQHVPTLRSLGLQGLVQVPRAPVILQWGGWGQGLGRGEGLGGQSGVWRPGCQGRQGFQVQGFGVLRRSWGTGQGLRIQRRGQG